MPRPEEGKRSNRNSRTIEVIVDREGNPTINALGFEDMSCKAATEFLERELGTVVSDEQTLDRLPAQEQHINQDNR
jgi:hypothetical protein